MGRHDEAAAEYHRAARIPGSDGIPFLMARDLMAWGQVVWLERKPEEATEKFELAWNRANQPRHSGPPGQSELEIMALPGRIEGKLKFLRGAGIRSKAAGP